MPARPFRKFTAWALFTAGLALVLLTSWPLPSQSVQWTATTDSIAYTFTLDWPSLVRVGENHTAVLVVKQMAASPAPSVSPTMLETRLEFNHLLIDPAGVISQPVGAAGVNEFRWSVTAWQAGKLPGTLWIYAATPDDPDMPQALAARTLELRAVGPGRSVIISLRWLGAALMLSGIFLLARLGRGQLLHY